MRRGLIPGAARFALLASALLGLTTRPALFYVPSTAVQPLFRTSAPPVPICLIQGEGFTSPYAGQIVSVHGVVFADLDETSKRGFFIQGESCDDRPSSSDGLFVYLGARQDVVTAGDSVQVTGTVQEYYGMTEISAAPLSVQRISSGNPLPEPVEVAPPFDNQAANRYWEALEGMSVRLDQAAVVGPTSHSDETWVVRSDLGVGRVFQNDPGGTGEIICVDDGGLYEITPEAKVGDQVTGLLGALEQSAGAYRIQLTARPQLILVSAAADRNPEQQPFTHLDTGLRVVTFNLADLFDAYDDPAVADTVLSAAEYQRRLQKRALAIRDVLAEPDLLAVQEVENLAVLQALAARPEIEADYGTVWVDGPDERGIDVALLYRTDRVEVLDYHTRQGCTSLVDGFGPDGNRDPAQPQNDLTCDLNGSGSLDGNRLFSRPPLVVHLRACPTGCPQDPEMWVELFLVINHWKSKIEDDDLVQYTLPRRLEEARFVAGLIQELLAAPNRNLIVLGDLNDFPDSQPLDIILDLGLRDMWSRVEAQSRYSFIYHGVSQILDYILVSTTLPLAPLEAVPVHLNADYPASQAGVSSTPLRSSDHDLFMLRFAWLDQLIFLPSISPGR